MAAKAKRRSRRMRAREAAQHKSRQASPETRPTVPYSAKGFAFAYGSETYIPAPAIPQTRSWRLLVLSAKLWLRNYNTAIALFILPMLVIVLGGVIIGDNNTGINRLMLGMTIIFFAVVWQLINIPASMYFQLQATKGLQPEIRDCYRGGWRQVVRLIGLSALTSALIFGGLLLFIVPGLILIRRYILSPYYLLDSNLGIREAMRRSAADTKEVSMYIWGIYGLLLGLNFLLFILFSQFYRPYGPLLAAVLTSFCYFGPALRYKEVALRRQADEQSTAA